MPIVCFELGAALVEGQGMAEVADTSIGVYEWESMWNQTNRTNRIPT